MFASLLAKIGFFILAVTPGAGCSLPTSSFFFLPRWWKYLKGQGDQLGVCSPVVHFPGDIWLIGLAVLDMLLALAGFVAVISIMVAGAQLVLAEGNPEKATNARQRLINSLIGLAIAVSATAMVTLLGSTVGGGGATANGLPNINPSNGTISDVLNIFFAIMGALAFLFIVIAGFRMVISSDNPTKVAEARRQIIYIAIGLLLIVVASAIVNFILGSIT